MRFADPRSCPALTHGAGLCDGCLAISCRCPSLTVGARCQFCDSSSHSPPSPDQGQATSCKTAPFTGGADAPITIIAQVLSPILPVASAQRISARRSCPSEYGPDDEPLSSTGRRSARAQITKRTQGLQPLCARGGRMTHRFLLVTRLRLNPHQRLRNEPKAAQPAPKLPNEPKAPGRRKAESYANIRSITVPPKSVSFSLRPL